MALDTRWKFPQGKNPEHLYDCLFNLIRELRKGAAGEADAVAAEDVSFDPAGVIAATDVQAAIEELDAEKANAAVTLTAGAGLTGGGDLSTNRTFAVGAGTGITVNADDVALANMAQATIKGRASGAGTGAPTDLTAAQVRTIIQPAGVVLATGTVTSQASLDINLSSFLSDYSSFEFRIRGVRPATDGADFQMRTDANAGASFDTGASDYSYAFLAMFDSGGGVGATDPRADNTADAITLMDDVGNATNEGGDMIATLYNPGAAAFETRMDGRGSYCFTDGTLTGFVVSGKRNAAHAVNAVQFRFSTGNIAEMAYSVIGLL